MARICIDLDGVIAKIKQPDQNYSEVDVVDGAVDYVNKLKSEGHYIIIFTARHMKTCNGNLSLVVKKIGKITIDWLEKHNIPFDEIQFGKPYAHYYIDDNAVRFNKWDQIQIDNIQSSNI